MFMGPMICMVIVRVACSSRGARFIYLCNGFSEGQGGQKRRQRLFNCPERVLLRHGYYGVLA
jgi:hypothetical protein